MTRIAAALMALIPTAAFAADIGGDVPIANPPAIQIEPLVGATDKPGLYIVRSHLLPGGLVRPHQHPDARHITVLSGVLYVCSSATVSAATVTAHKAGEFFTIPPNTVHCSWGKDGEVYYIEVGVGPSGTKYVEK